MRRYQDYYVPIPAVLVEVTGFEPANSPGPKQLTSVFSSFFSVWAFLVPFQPVFCPLFLLSPPAVFPVTVKYGVKLPIAPPHESGWQVVVLFGKWLTSTCQVDNQSFLLRNIFVQWYHRCFTPLLHNQRCGWISFSLGCLSERSTLIPVFPLDYASRRKPWESLWGSSATMIKCPLSRDLLHNEKTSNSPYSRSTRHL